MRDRLIALEGVAVTIGSIEVLAPVWMSIGAGDRVVVVGSNGAGKTTLLRVVLGRVEPTSGTLIRDPELEEPGAVASLIGPAPLFRDLTVADHLAMLRAAWGDRGQADRPDRVLAALRLGLFLDRFPAELSSGERQLVGLALVLSRPARLLVLDEPEQRLDVERRAAIADLIAARTDDGCAVMVATHGAAIGAASAATAVRLG